MFCTRALYNTAKKPGRFNAGHHVTHHAPLLVQAPDKIFNVQHWVVVARRGVKYFNVKTNWQTFK